MRRTTISRSSRALVTVLIGLAVPGTGAAQDTTAVREPLADQEQRVHVVQRGETLWELAQRYYLDPFLWPEIYRLNTLVVEDPHWIFPGEELQLSGIEAMRGAGGGERPMVTPPPRAPAPPASVDAPTVFSKPAVQSAFRMSRERSLVYRFRALRPGEFYSAGFLTEGEALPWAGVLGAVGRPTLRNLTASSAALVFGEVELDTPAGATYADGDSLLIAQLAREVPGWGHMVVPTGLARVTAVAGRKARAEIIAQFGRVADGQFALPAERYTDPGDVVPVPVDNGIMGRIITVRGVSLVPGQLSIVFVDLGRGNGVAVGDLFEVLSADGSEPFGDTERRPVAVIQIVHVRERSASGLVTAVFDLGIEAGAPIRLTRKMPS